MSQKKKDGLTEHQRYTLGRAVELAMINKGWNGTSLGAHDAPRLYTRGRWYSHYTNCSRPTAAVLLRAGLIREHDGTFTLERKGVEIGEAECKERLGVHPKVQAEKNKAEQDAIDKKQADDLAALAAPFANIMVKYGDNKRAKRLDKIIIEEGGRLTLDEKELSQIGEQL